MPVVDTSYTISSFTGPDLGSTGVSAILASHAIPALTSGASPGEATRNPVAHESECRDAAKAERNDVLGFDSVSVKNLEERKRKVLVEKNLHDACRTAGGRCAATWAAY